MLQRIAVYQLVGSADADDEIAEKVLSELAGSFEPGDVQLFYQTALMGRRDLPLAPDAVTLPRLLGGAGYDLAYIGKWHLASDDGLGVPEREQINHVMTAIPPERRGGWDVKRSLNSMPSEAKSIPGKASRIPSQK